MPVEGANATTLRRNPLVPPDSDPARLFVAAVQVLQDGGSAYLDLPQRIADGVPLARDVAHTW